MRPPFLHFPELHTQHLVLRQVQPTDVPQLREIMFYDGKPAETAGQARQMLDKIAADYLQGNTVNWVIADKITNQPLGTCGYYRGFKNHTGEIGYVMRPMARGRGFMTEAVSALVRFGFRQLKLQQVVAYTNTHNLASIQVLHRAGFLQVPGEEEQYLKCSREAGSS